MTDQRGGTRMWTTTDEQPEGRVVCTRERQSDDDQAVTVTFHGDSDAENEAETSAFCDSCNAEAFAPSLGERVEVFHEDGCLEQKTNPAQPDADEGEEKRERDWEAAYDDLGKSFLELGNVIIEVCATIGAEGEDLEPDEVLKHVLQRLEEALEKAQEPSPRKYLPQADTDAVMERLEEAIRALAEKGHGTLWVATTNAFTLLRSQRQEIEEIFGDYMRVRADRAALLDIKSTDGLSSSEWVMRTAKAEAEVKRLIQEDREEGGAALAELDAALRRADAAEAENIRLQGELEMSTGCLDLIREDLEAQGTDMSQTPPMMYNDAMRATFARKLLEGLENAKNGIERALANQADTAVQQEILHATLAAIAAQDQRKEGTAE